MDPTYSARLSPWQGRTTWTLEAQHLVERRGAHERRLALSELKSIRAGAMACVLRFRGHAPLSIPALSYGGWRPMDQGADFAAFLTVLLAAAPIKAMGMSTHRGPRGAADPVIWTMALLAAGAAAMLAFSATVGAWALGLTLAARLVFLLILAGAILPWLNRTER